MKHLVSTTFLFFCITDKKSNQSATRKLKEHLQKNQMGLIAKFRSWLARVNKSMEKGEGWDEI